jgi:hypothetical protein
MNPNPQRKSIWQMLLITIRYATVIVASLYVIDVSGQLAFHMAIPMQGKSSADVGVAVYEHSERGVALWLVVFPMFSYVFLFLIKQALCKNSNLPYWIGGIASIPCTLFYLWFLNW